MKVLAIPPPTITPPADGIPDGANVTALAPVKALDELVGDSKEMRNEMLSAITMLQEAYEQADGLPPRAEEALDYLINAMAKRTKWCNCPPGQCAGEDQAGCRLNSPLVKA